MTKAAELFRERGSAGVSVADVMKAAKLTHGPFYNHFGSKEELLDECVRAASGRTIKLLDGYEPTSKGLHAYRDWYLGANHVDDPGHGCLVAALGSEANRNDKLRPSITAHLKASIEKLARRFPWSSKRNARAESIRFFASMLGAIVMARAVDDEAFSDEILRAVRRSIG